MPSIYEIANNYASHGKWRNGGHRGPMTASQKKAKVKARKKRKARK